MPLDTPTSDADHHRAALRELIDLGLSFARLVHDEAQAAAQPTPEATAETPPDPTRTATLAVAFDRASRAVRRAIALSRSLDTPPPNPHATPRQAARRQIIRALEDTIAADAEPGQAPALHAELCDRLDSPEFEQDLAGRPVAEIITELHRDLGLADIAGVRLWKRRTPGEIATLHARAAAPPGAASHPALITTFPPIHPGAPTPDETNRHLALALAGYNPKPLRKP